MIKVNIFEAKARLSEFLEAVEAGERVLICKRNQPVAELTRVFPARSAPRPVGGAKGQFVVPPTFFAPLPEEFVGAFDSDLAAPEPRATRVAERGPGHLSQPKKSRTSRRRLR